MYPRIAGLLFAAAMWPSPATAMDGGSAGNAGAAFRPTAMDGGSAGNAGAVSRAASEPRPIPKPVVTSPVAGAFLVARRELASPAFFQSVVLLLRHDKSGSFGVIVNRRTRFRLHDLLPDLEHGAAPRPVFVGGPVALHALVVLMRREKPAAGIERVTDEISFSADRQVLEALIARHKPAADLRFYIGYAGWGAGQLDAELARGSWYVVQAAADAVFGDDDENLWQRLIDRLDPPGIRVRQPPDPRWSRVAIRPWLRQTE